MTRTVSLAAARELFARRGPFRPADSQMLRAAALTPEFAPATNAIDSKIEDYLFATFGPAWRAEAAAPDAAPAHLTREEAARWRVADAHRRDVQRAFDAVRDDFFAARGALMRTVDPRFLGARSTADDRAEKAYRAACDRLTAARRVVREIEAQAAERRYWDSVGTAA